MLNKIKELNNMKLYKNEGITYRGQATQDLYLIKKDFYGWTLHRIDYIAGNVIGIESMMQFKKDAINEIEKIENQYKQSPKYIARLLDSGLIDKDEHDKKLELANMGVK